MESPPKPPPVFVEEPAPRHDAYETVADVVGFVPNVRRQDNVFQAKFIGVSALVCIVVGLLWMKIVDGEPWWMVMIVGAVAGMFFGVLISGTILAFRNIKRHR